MLRCRHYTTFVMTTVLVRLDTATLDLPKHRDALMKHTRAVGHRGSHFAQDRLPTDIRSHL